MFEFGAQKRPCQEARQCSARHAPDESRCAACEPAAEELAEAAAVAAGSENGEDAVCGNGPGAVRRGVRRSITARRRCRSPATPATRGSAPLGRMRHWPRRKKRACYSACRTHDHRERSDRLMNGTRCSHMPDAGNQPGAHHLSLRGQTFTSEERRSSTGVTIRPQLGACEVQAAPLTDQRTASTTGSSIAFPRKAAAVCGQNVARARTVRQRWPKTPPDRQSKVPPPSDFSRCCHDGRESSRNLNSQIS